MIYLWPVATTIKWKVRPRKQSIWTVLLAKYFQGRSWNMYRSIFRAGRRLYASKLWKTVDSELTSNPRSINASVLLARCSSSSTQKFSLSQIAPSSDAFSRRHIGPNAVEENEMLRTLDMQVGYFLRYMYITCLTLFCAYKFASIWILFYSIKLIHGNVL